MLTSHLRVTRRSLLTLVAVILVAGAGGCGKWADRLACTDGDCTWTRDQWGRIASLANVAAQPPPRDDSNAVLPGDQDWLNARLDDGAAALQIPAVRLGWLLYFDPALSGAITNKDTVGRDADTPRPAVCGSVNVSCATCHDPQRYGSDFTSVPGNVSDGAGFYDVNIQQTLNAARFPILYWNGRADALWAQAAQVMESGVSMNGDRLNTVYVLATKYADLYAAAFTDPADALPALAGLPRHGKPGVAAYDALPDATKELATRLHGNAAKAIGAYEWFLTSDNSAFDQFVNEGASSSKLTDAQKRGLTLFIGHASCFDCHRTPMFSDGQFHNIGIPQTGVHVPTVPVCDTKGCDCSALTNASCLPSGAYGGLEKLATQTYRRCTTDCPMDGKPTDKMMGAWRTPSLRDVAMTAPYMHDGSLATLSDVVWHYDQAAVEGASLGTSELTPLNLTNGDRDDLVAFLQSLTGQPGPKLLVTPPGESGPDGGAVDGAASGAPACPTTVPDGGATADGGAEDGG
jgi:cytochrome c peroxidase